MLGPRQAGYCRWFYQGGEFSYTRTGTVQTQDIHLLGKKAGHQMLLSGNHWQRTEGGDIDG